VIDAASTAPIRSNEPWELLAGLWLLWLFIGAYAIVPASVLPLVTTQLNVGLAAASWIVTAPQVGAAIMGVPIGAVLDRVQNVRAIVLASLCLFITSFVGWVAGANGAYWPLVASRLLGGIALVTVWVAGTSVLSAAFSPRYRTTVVAVYTTGYPAGYALGQFAAPLITVRLGWPATFLVFGVLVAAVLPLCYVAGRQVVRPSSEQVSTAHNVAAVAANRNVWIVCVVSFTVYSLYMIFNSWMPTYLTRTFGLSLAESGLFVALFPAVGIAARTSGGIVSDRLFGRRKRPIVVLSFGTTTLVVAVLFGISTPIAFVAGLVVAGFCLQLQIGVLYTYVQGFVETKTVGTAVALVSVIGWVGAFVAPAMTGALVDLTGNYIIVLVYTVVFGLAGTLVGWLAPEPRS
jgi:NNP family nitrate/nitrite transporter-like MFS transporter